MLERVIKNQIEKHGLTDELQKKIDVLFFAGKISEDLYLSSINKEGYHIERIDEHTLQLVNDVDTDTANDGTDYLKPITYTDGMTVDTGLWYTDGEDIWEAIADGVPTGFNDKDFFDIIEI